MATKDHRQERAKSVGWPDRESSTLTAEQARVVCSRAQGLERPSEHDPANIVRRYGFVRTLGGSDVYLAVRARSAAATIFESLNLASSRMEVQVVPAVRGCMYLVHREHAAVALAIADELSSARRRREYTKVGLAADEIARLAEAVVECLQNEPMTTERLRRELPDGAIRSFGEIGRKVGLSSSLPPVLREMEFGRRIERTLPNGRLDSEKYEWRIAAEQSGGAAPGSNAPVAGEDVVPRLAQWFLRWIGTASASVLSGWSGFAKTRCRKALQALTDDGRARLVKIDGRGDCYVSEDALSEAVGHAETDQGKHERLCFLPFEDNLIQLQGGAGPLVAKRHSAIEIPRWGQSRKTTTIGEAKHLGLRAITRSGRLVGFWEADLETGRAVMACLDPISTGERSEIQQAADETVRFLLEEVGHALWFSIDKEESIARRAAEVRRLDGMP